MVAYSQEFGTKQYWDCITSHALQKSRKQRNITLSLNSVLFFHPNLLKNLKIFKTVVFKCWHPSFKMSFSSSLDRIAQILIQYVTLKMTCKGELVVQFLKITSLRLIHNVYKPYFQLCWYFVNMDFTWHVSDIRISDESCLPLLPLRLKQTAGIGRLWLGVLIIESERRQDKAVCTR